jgi:hypothetical protein
MTTVAQELSALHAGDMLIETFGGLPTEPSCLPDVVALRRDARGVIYVCELRASLAAATVLIEVTDETGRSSRQLKVSDLFPESWMTVWSGEGRVELWCRALWLTPDDATLVVAASSGRVRVVDLATGDVRRGSAADIADRLAPPACRGYLVKRERALDAANAIWWDEVQPRLFGWPVIPPLVVTLVLSLVALAIRARRKQVAWQGADEPPLAASP